MAQSFVLAAFATLVCQRNCVFLCKGTKLKIVMPVFCDTELRFGIEKAISCATALCQNPRIRRSRILGIVCRFSPWYAFLPLIPAVWGFGLGLLGGQGFIGAKASLDPLCRAFVAQSFGFAAFKKAGKLYFLQSSQTKGRGETNFFDA